MPRHAPAVGASFFVMMNNQRCRLDGDAVRRPLKRSIQNESKNPYGARRQVAGSARACLPCLPSQGGIGRGQDGRADERSTRAGGVSRTRAARACPHKIAIGDRDLINVRFGPLCGLKSDISRGRRSAISGHSRVEI